MLFLRAHTKCQQKMKCSHSQCSNSFVFMFILSNFALLFEVYRRILATWDNEPLRTEHRMGHTFSLYTKCRKLCRQRFFFWPGPDRTTRACSHFRDTFPSTFLSCGFENSKIFRASVHPIVQLPRQSVYPSIHPSIRLSIHPSIRPSICPTVCAGPPNAEQGRLFSVGPQVSGQAIALGVIARRLLCARLHNSQLIEYIPHN